MTEQKNEDLTREERRAFGSLAETGSPPPDLENRVVEMLRGRGLVRRAPWWERALAAVPRPVRLATAAGALVLTFVAGVEYGKRSSEATIPEVRLEPPAEEEKPGATERTRDHGGALMASSKAGPEEIEVMMAGLEKPRLAELDEGYGDFPPYPLEGRPRAISPKYR